MTSIQEIAGTAEKAIEAVMRVEPIAMTLSSFIPGAAPVMAIVHPAVVALAPFIEKALIDLAAGHNGDALTAVFQLIQHISRGQPNSNLLGTIMAAAQQVVPTPPAHPAANQDPSAQGSG